MKPQEMGPGVEELKLSAASSGEPSAPHQPSVNAAQDQDHVREMEESYGIREEGIF